MATELDFLSGFTGTHRNALKYLPNDANMIMYGAGCNVVVQDIGDFRKQCFLRGHDEHITCIAVSADGQVAVSGQIGSTTRKGAPAPVIVWDMVTRQRKHELTGLAGRVVCLDISPDGRFAVGAGQNQVFCIWDTLTGDLVYNRLTESIVSFAIFSTLGPSGPHSSVHAPAKASYFLYSAMESSVLAHELRFDLGTMGYILSSAPFAMPNTGVQRRYTCGLTVSTRNNNTSFLIAATTAGEICVFSLSGLVFRAAIPLIKGGVACMCPVYSESPEYSTLMIGGGDGMIKQVRGTDTMWEFCAESFFGEHISSITASPNHKQVIAGLTDGRLVQVMIQKYETNNPDEIRVPSSTSTRASLKEAVVSSPGVTAAMLASLRTGVGQNGGTNILQSSLLMCTVASGVYSVDTDVADPREIIAETAQKSFGNRLILASAAFESGELAVWELDSYSKLASYKTPSRAKNPDGSQALAFTCLTFTHHKNQLFTGGNDGMLRCFEIQPNQNWNRKSDLGASHPDGPQPTSSSSSNHQSRSFPNSTNNRSDQIGKNLFLGDSAGSYLQELPGQLNQLWETNAHKGSVTSVGCALKGSLVVTGGDDGTVRVWKGKEMIGQFSEHRKPVKQVLIDTQLTHMVHSVSEDRQVISYCLKKNRVTRHLAPSPITCLTQRRDHEQELITGHVDGRLLFWDIDYPDFVGVLVAVHPVTGLSPKISAAKISPSGRFVAAGGSDGMIYAWDLKDGKPAQITDGHSTGNVASVAWTSDEKQIVSGSSDKTLAVWNFFP